MSLPATRTLWEEGREPGREMVALGVALALTAAAADLLLTDRVGVLYDLAFVALCVALALLVRPPDFFTVGILPPLLMAATFLFLAASSSEAIAAADDGVLQAVVTGLSHHSGALTLGYLGCLAVLFVRQRVVAARSLDRDHREHPGRAVHLDDLSGPASSDADPASVRSGPGPRLHA